MHYNIQSEDCLRRLEVLMPDLRWRSGHRPADDMGSVFKMFPYTVVLGEDGMVMTRATSNTPVPQLGRPKVGGI